MTDDKLSKFKPRPVQQKESGYWWMLIGFLSAALLAMMPVWHDTSESDACYSEID